MSPETIKEILSWLSILGVPSIFAMTAWCVKTCRVYSKQIKILFQSQQAQMRAQLLKDYKEYDKKGYILDIELKDWENQYQAYHQLGANGVLNDRYERLLQLPNDPPVSEDKPE